MRRKPRNAKTDRLVTLKLALFSYIWLGSWQALAGFIAYITVFMDYGIPASALPGSSFTYFRKSADDFYGYTADEQLRILSEAQTAFFVAVVLTRMGCILVCRTRKLSIFKRDMFK